tara:strand:- start:366 stop:560 length:195 start_codon:yes stop_codon:yes gene_type:complete
MDSKIVGFGRSHFIDESRDHSVRIDLPSTDSFIRELLNPEGIRLAHVEQIVPTKIEIVGRGSQK